MDRPPAGNSGHPALPHAPGTRARQLMQASYRRPPPQALHGGGAATGWSRRRSPLSYLDPAGAMPVISNTTSRQSVCAIASLAFTSSMGYEGLIMTSPVADVHGQKVDSI